MMWYKQRTYARSACCFRWFDGSVRVKTFFFISSWTMLDMPSRIRMVSVDCATKKVEDGSISHNFQHMGAIHRAVVTASGALPMLPND